MWELVAQVSTGFALAAFLIAAVVAVISRKSREKSDLIRLAPEDDRAPLVSAALESYQINGSHLSPKDQTRIVLKQIDGRQARFKQASIVVCILALLAASLAAYAMFRLSPIRSEEQQEQSNSGPAERTRDGQNSPNVVLPEIAAKVSVTGQENVSTTEYQPYQSDVTLSGYGPRTHTAVPGEGWQFDLNREVTSTEIAGQAGTCYGVDINASTTQGIVVKANNSSTRAGFPPERREGWVQCRLRAQRYRTTSTTRSFRLPQYDLEWQQPLYIDLPHERTSFVARIELFDGTEVPVDGARVHPYFQSSVVGDQLIIEPRRPERGG